jgi:hypothetical protein
MLVTELIAILKKHDQKAEVSGELSVGDVLVALGRKDDADELDYAAANCMLSCDLLASMAEDLAAWEVTPPKPRPRLARGMLELIEEMRAAKASMEATESLPDIAENKDPRSF